MENSKRCSRCGKYADINAQVCKNCGCTQFVITSQGSPKNTYPQSNSVSGNSDNKSEFNTSECSQPTGQPAQQPVQQPVQQPTGQPAQEPVQQPVQQPTGQPFSQPFSQPTPTAHQDNQNESNQQKSFNTLGEYFQQPESSYSQSSSDYNSGYGNYSEITLQLKKKPKKTLIIVISIILAIAVLGAVGYFVLPSLLGKSDKGENGNSEKNESYSENGDNKEDKKDEKEKKKDKEKDDKDKKQDSNDFIGAWSANDSFDSLIKSVDPDEIDKKDKKLLEDFKDIEISIGYVIKKDRSALKILNKDAINDIFDKLTSYYCTKDGIYDNLMSGGKTITEADEYIEKKGGLDAYIKELKEKYSKYSLKEKLEEIEEIEALEEIFDDADINTYKDWIVLSKEKYTVSGNTLSFKGQNDECKLAKDKESFDLAGLKFKKIEMPKNNEKD